MHSPSLFSLTLGALALAEPELRVEPAALAPAPSAPTSGR